MAKREEYLYHYWHHKSFNNLDDWSSIELKVPTINDPNKKEKKKFYSLKKDMDTLREIGAKKGIVDRKVIDVGKSIRGRKGGKWKNGKKSRKLWALKVGKGTANKILFTGCHHAREWISVEIPYLVAEYLIENYTDKPKTKKERRIFHLLNNREIWFVPMVNPDGHEFSTRKNRGWRPNRNKYVYKKDFEVTVEFLDVKTKKKDKLLGTVKEKAKKGKYTGVDINRNYATSTWGLQTDNTYKSPMGNSGANSVWCGPKANSEVETQAITNLIKKQKFKASISYHSFGQLLLYPDAMKKDTFAYKVGLGMDILMDEYEPYKFESGGGLYPTTGDLLEYSYEAMPNLPTFLPELRPLDIPSKRKHIFSGLPESEIKDCFKENIGAALALINCAGHIDLTKPGEPGHATGKIKASNAKTPAVTVQSVRNCWQVFKKDKWDPEIEEHRLKKH